MNIVPNLSKRKLKTPRNSAPLKVAKPACLLNHFEVDPPKPDLPILEALENQPQLLEELVLKDNPTADHVKLEDNPAADHVKLEDNPADPFELDYVAVEGDDIDAVMVDNYEELENDEKEEFYPNKANARKMLNQTSTLSTTLETKYTTLFQSSMLPILLKKME
ncbi:hypothetical protein TNCT_429821 [Trichonephila clavata]|uniref:Uncharacterized protein n=1 Tax=Trichonephila clavata TaxID=2740835 RepID=A0A8X6G7V1_TRICU|nr:hypothetical protein TNCT_429821 [Trichonephila clavata]